MKGIPGKTYTIEDVIVSFERKVNKYKKETKSSLRLVEKYAEKLHHDEYRDLIHPYIIDQFRVGYEKTQKDAQKKIQAFIDKTKRVKR